MLGADTSAVRSDLRDLRVGMKLGEIPAGGYVNLRCATEAEKTLASWFDYKQCAVDGYGRHAVHFEFDEKTNVLGSLDDKYRGTKVGGHPVILTLLIDHTERVVGLDIETDNNTRLFLRKKAHMLGRQAMSFYGDDGWTCERRQPGSDEAPIGGLFIRERCSKTVDGKDIVVHRDFYRPLHGELKDFVSTAKIEVHSIK
ncbi:hypothetical protein [Hyphomicrobium sp.]|uniref:hypothetical protein n=1 Tax=Hyphomicrobium sp. TaxID=82 RepID=UPI0025BE384A|nr:hypothetical protein [Hyphomicrobium sp.]MCC7253970.1 hypothetical protein [Hyphomicrobium sp.]